MLDAMRKASKTWPAKFLLLVLALSFGAWGITDYIRPSSNTPAITVGGQSFSDGYIRERFNTALSDARARGNDITTQQAISAGLLDQIVKGIARDAVYAQGLQLLDVHASDDAVRRMIVSTPNFMDDQGKFNRAALQEYARQQRTTESALVEAVRGNLSVAYLMDSIAPGVSYPDEGIDLMSGYLSERRTGEALFIDASKLPDPAAEPKDAAVLQTLYDDNIALFTVPERRQATVLLLTLDGVAEAIDVTEDDVRTNYARNSDQFSLPIKRDVVQAFFPTREKADQAFEAIRQGASLKDAAKLAGVPNLVEMGQVAKAALPEPFATLVFAQPVGEIGPPVQSDLGWHIFQIRSESSAQTASFESVKDHIEAELRHEKATDLAWSIARSLEDAIAGGATLEESSAKFGGTLLSVKLDAFGRGADGVPSAVLPEDPKILKNLFSLGDGDIAPLGEYAGGYYILRVDEIIPAAPKPFDEVKPDLIKIWRSMERRRQADDLARSLQAKARNGASLESLAKSDRAISFSRVGPVSRTDPEQGVSVGGENLLKIEGDRPGDLPVLDALFAARPDGVEMVSLPKGAALVRVVEVSAAGAEEASVTRAALASRLAESLAKDIEGLFEESLARKVGYQINAARINSLLQQD